MREEEEVAEPEREEGRKVYKAQDVRGGEIILKTRRRRIIFIAGLAALVLIAILARIAA